MTNKTFIFKYDPELTPEGMFADFWKAADGKKSLREPHIIRSNSIKALDEDLKRMDLFTTLVRKGPNSLTELAKLMGRDYNDILNEAQVLENMGIITLKEQAEEIRPIALYDQVIFDFSAQEKAEESLINMIQMETITNWEHIKQITNRRLGTTYLNYDIRK